MKERKIGGKVVERLFTPNDPVPEAKPPHSEFLLLRNLGPEPSDDTHHDLSETSLFSINDRVNWPRRGHIPGSTLAVDGKVVTITGIRHQKWDGSQE